MDKDIVMIDGYPTTSVRRTLLDLGRVASSLELELAVESACIRRLPGTPSTGRPIAKHVLTICAGKRLFPRSLIVCVYMVCT
jgi:hypothetical protein